MGSPHRFILIIEGGAVEKSALLVQAGCADASIGAVDGTEFAEFERPASTLEDALASAISAVESVAGLHVRRVEPDDLVTAAEIAERLGRSRESVRLLAKGTRGMGDFPNPVSHLRSRQRLWRWSDIAAWAGTVDDDQQQEALLVATVNAALEYRRLAPTVGGFVPSLLGIDPAKPRAGSYEEQPLEAAEEGTAPSPEPLPAATPAPAFPDPRPAATPPAEGPEAMAARPSTSYWKRSRAVPAAAPPAEAAPPPEGEREPPKDDTASASVVAMPDANGDDRRLGRRHKNR